jgi:hypothetical protein
MLALAIRKPITLFMPSAFENNGFKNFCIVSNSFTQQKETLENQRLRRGPLFDNGLGKRVRVLALSRRRTYSADGNNLSRPHHFS